MTYPSAARGCTPDLNAEPTLLEQVFESRPEVLPHNVEAVLRILKRIRYAAKPGRTTR